MAESKIDMVTVMEYLKGQLPVELQERTIDNPGKGNCGFYAFAIGLIDIIQEEKTYNCRATFDRLVSLDSSLNKYYDIICNYDFDKPNNELLENLHRALRVITYNVQLTELRQACVHAKQKDEYQALVATSAYRKFAGLYYGTDVDPRYNEFATSPTILNAIAQIDRGSVVENHEALVLVPVFMSLIYGSDVAHKSITLETEPLATSPILQAMQGITQDFVWANHLDLDYLANSFGVNLHTLENGSAKYQFQDLPHQHTITLNNQYNTHWTTKVTMAKTAEILKQRSSEVVQGFSASKEIKPRVDLPADPKQLDKLIRNVNRAVIAYCTYSDSIWFSLFHHHGKAGRARARQFNQTFSQVVNYDTAKEMLINFLNDDRNGNTYPHSFRTMLLKELLAEQPNKKNVDLKAISKDYRNTLEQFKAQIQPPAQSLDNNYSP